MNNFIELYLVSGFLGSGKTTFLQNTLQNEDADGRVGVIVNEFGSIGIDGTLIDNGDIKLVEINNGSIFCACLKDGFVKTLAAFLQQPIDKLYVEASGMADPSNIEQLLAEIEPLVLKRYTTDRRYLYRGCITIVDGSHFLELAESLVAPVMQVKKSNLVVLNKTDMISEEEKAQVLAAVREINPDAQVYCTSYAKVPKEILASVVYEAASDMKQEQAYGSKSGDTSGTAVTSNTIQNRPYSAVISLDGIYNYVSMVTFFQALAKKLYRMKGFFCTANGSFYVSGVGEQVQFNKTTIKETDEKKVVLISNETSPELTAWINDEWNKNFKTPLVIEEDLYFGE